MSPVTLDAAAPDGAGQVVRLPYEPPLHAGALFGFLSPRAVPGVEEVVEPAGPDADGGTAGPARIYRRTFRADGVSGWVELRVDEAEPAVLLRAWPQAPAGLVAAARRLLDLDAAPSVIAGVVGADPVLAPLVAAAPGMRVPGAWDGFEVAVRAVLGQQVSVAAARTLLGRLVRLAGPPLAAAGSPGPSPGLPAGGPGPGGELSRLFPGPADVLAADLSALGVPGSRRRTLVALAEAVAEGRVRLDAGADPVATSRRLQELPGIGPWTAAYVALRALADRDALLVGDLALLRAAVRHGLPGTWPELVAHAERWRPWRGYACLWLWST